MVDDFINRIKNMYESKRSQMKKEVNDALLNVSKRIEQKKEELYKEVL